MIEKDFDVSFVADMALREKQIQQNYRPIIAVHKWFARRPGTLFRSLILSEFVGGDLQTEFFRSHQLSGLRIADPFMGGGTPLIEANRLGCDVTGYDINPMAYWVVQQELGGIDLDAYRTASVGLQEQLEKVMGTYYRTKCLRCGSEEATAKYFIWVKTATCRICGKPFDLFPGYLLAEDRRHPRNVLICWSCGELNEVADRAHPGVCSACGSLLQMRGPATRSRCACPHCNRENSYPSPDQGAPRHRLVAIEYYCPQCKPSHSGRFFKKPDEDDLRRYDECSRHFSELGAKYVPDDEIPPGDETGRLHKWGYKLYREMFNDRQLLGLELSCRLIAAVGDRSIRNALATNLSDLLRYQNMLCRYDTMALKSLDVFSVHGFPVGLIQCESNLLGVQYKTSNVGSGGWSNIVDKYTRAKRYCGEPFETAHRYGRKVQIPVPGEWIGETRTGMISHHRDVSLHCSSSTMSDLPSESIDAVLTDPPYFGNVQYAELMDFCYIWLRRLVGDSDQVFAGRSTRSEHELTGNATMERGLTHFTEGLSAVFGRMARALKAGSPLAFTYHHNALEAYFPVAVAILDSGLACTACIPCPAEMGASIHINGTGSSIIDTVFVCRSKGSVSRSSLAIVPEDFARLVRYDLRQLNSDSYRPAHGDIRCIAYGHLIRMAIWNLRSDWSNNRATSEKLKLVERTIIDLGGWHEVEKALSQELSCSPCRQQWVALDAQTEYGGWSDEISF
ncbi:MAG: DUF1156 domain-containing protein [Firmicutes bacterium]|nr:DUF1156 domain-containing protein [Bacillota bacterium]